MAEAKSIEDVSVAELETRLKTFREQLDGVDALLAQDPSNTEVAGIRNDLEEVLKLTHEMLKVKRATAPTEFKDAEILYAVGSDCEAIYQARWYPGRIRAVELSQDNQVLYEVEFYGFGNIEKVVQGSVRSIEENHLLTRVDQNQVKVGLKCQAKYYVDGVFYPCTIKSFTATGYKVHFDSYGNTEDVPLEYLYLANEQPAEETTKAVPAAAPPAPAAAEPTKLVKIPENLKILPTDTEDEKQRKRKRIRAIKSLNRHKAIDIERDTKQQGWKSFQMQNQKRKVRGAISNLRKGSSIFKSPDTVEGRVGVIGSGQGMTQFENTRKKYKLTGSTK